MDFNKIHETFRPKILRYLNRMVNQEEAEDFARSLYQDQPSVANF